MTKIIIEHTQSKDFLAIAALDRKAWLDNKNAEYVPDGEHAWRIWCEHSVMFSAKCGDDIVGVILAFYCENESYCLHKVMVSGDYRGKGIGGLLFKALFSALDNKSVDCFLTVDPINTAAISLYKTWGFDQATLVTGYYRADEDRYVMTRTARVK